MTKKTTYTIESAEDLTEFMEEAAGFDDRDATWEYSDFKGSITVTVEFE